ncbi:MAG: DUF5706 domain-containing protein [Candidatus Bathyarchaeota archaeon]|nr:DUF5706 domain-containing protein [Candidatus Termiticorpusculum sp.]
MSIKIEHLRKTYEAINELIRFADAKAIAIMATDGVIAGLFFSNTSTIQTLLIQKAFPFALFIISVVFMLLSVGAAAYCIFPRLKMNSNNCLVFFGDIAKFKTAEDYGKAVKEELTDEKIEFQLLDQVWANSKIAAKKYHAIRVSIISFVALLVLSALFVLAVILG